MDKPPTIIKKVLLVDDDDNIRLIIQMSLEGPTDWQILTAESGTQALSIVAQEHPDLILLDVMMPGKDGLAVFKELKQTYKSNMPAVIFMTAKVQAHEIEQYTKLGANGVITKPFNPLTLPADIKALLSSKS